MEHPKLRGGLPANVYWLLRAWQLYAIAVLAIYVVSFWVPTLAAWSFPEFARHFIFYNKWSLMVFYFIFLLCTQLTIMRSKWGLDMMRGLDKLLLVISILSFIMSIAVGGLLHPRPGEKDVSGAMTNFIFTASGALVYLAGINIILCSISIRILGAKDLVYFFDKEPTKS
jgi:hypothetical protein